MTRKLNRKRTGFEDKTLWDWLNLLGVLAIPLVVVGATIAFGIIQFNLAEQQHLSDQKLADQQHQADQNQALDQQQAAIFQTYIDNIQDLLLNHKLLSSRPSDAVAILARARTLTALPALDPERKVRLLKFLYEAKLIGFENNNHITHPPIIDLSGADLSHDDLSNVDLRGANLNGAYLNFAILNSIDLSDAHLYDANLSSTDLRSANLSGADFTGANLNDDLLRGTDLRGANLMSVNLTDDIDLTQQQLDQVYSCKDAILPKGLTCHKNQ